MAQWIITICILAAALAYALYRVHRYFRRRVMKAPDKHDFCKGCHSDCGSCAMISGGDPKKTVDKKE